MKLVTFVIVIVSCLQVVKSESIETNKEINEYQFVGRNLVEQGNKFVCLLIEIIKMI